MHLVLISKCKAFGRFSKSCSSPSSSWFFHFGVPRGEISQSPPLSFRQRRHDSTKDMLLICSYQVPFPAFRQGPIPRVGLGQFYIEFGTFDVPMLKEIIFQEYLRFCDGD